MIASLAGTVEAVGISSAVISVAGIGMEFLAAPATLSHLFVGEHARVFTSLVVREDSLTLFGFDTVDEREVFQTLLGVSGIGPRIALTIISVLPPDNLRSAIANKDEAALTRVPGIGKKGAQRMILELGTKLGAPHNSAHAAFPSSGSAADADVLEALVNLGWQERAARSAIDEARKEDAPAPFDVPELLRRALQILGSKR